MRKTFVAFVLFVLLGVFAQQGFAMDDDFIENDESGDAPAVAEIPDNSGAFFPAFKGIASVAVGTFLIFDASHSSGDMNFIAAAEGVGAVVAFAVAIGCFIQVASLSSRQKNAELYVAPVYDFERAGAGLNLRLLF